MFRDEEEILAYVTQLQSEHRRVKQCLGRVERHWQCWRQEPRSEAGVGELISSLADLREELAHHFAEEQAGGCLEEAVSCAPHYGREAAELARSAPRLLELVDHLIDELRKTPKSIETTEKQYGQLVEQICRYETAESCIVEQSFGLSEE